MRYRMEYLIYGTIDLLADSEADARREFEGLTATEVFDDRTNEVRDVKLFRVTTEPDEP
ncbi:MAG TPA: hypothetical protein VFV36_10120 [Candidatus Methylomirabilis sp.]|nr:hypothetical protein [Candidatus Methylomirabilis sp.]